MHHILLVIITIILSILLKACNLIPLVVTFQISSTWLHQHQSSIFGTKSCTVQAIWTYLEWTDGAGGYCKLRYKFSKVCIIYCVAKMSAFIVTEVVSMVTLRRLKLMYLSVGSLLPWLVKTNFYSRWRVLMQDFESRF